MADVGHAGTEEDVLDRGAGNLGEDLDVVRIVRAGEDRLGDLGQIDLDDGGVLCVCICCQQFRSLEPLVDGIDPVLQGLCVLVAVGDHLAHERHVGAQVLGDGLLGELDAPGGGAPLCGGVGQLEGLLDGKLGKPFHLEDAAVEHVDLVLLGHGEQPLLDGPERDRVHRVAQRDAGVELALETDQHGLRHVERHEAQGAREGDQPGAGREGDADRETGVGVAAGPDGIRDQETVQPGVDDAVARLQRHAATLDDEVRQRLVHLDVGRLRVGGGVAEGLHEHRGEELQAGQFLQLVGRHRAGGVLRADGGHGGLAGGAGEDTLDAAGAADHLLGQRVPLPCLGNRVHREGEHLGRGETKGLPGAVGQRPADDQGDPAAGAELVGEGVRCDGEGGEQLARLALDLALFGIDDDDVAGLHLGDVGLDRERAGVLGGVEEDRGDDAADDDAVPSLVGNCRDVLPDVPEHAVAGRFPGGAGADHVAHESDLEAVCPELGDGVVAVREAGLAHGERVQRDVGTAPGVACRGEVVGVDLAVYLVNLDLHRLGQPLFGGEPLCGGPGIKDLLGGGVALGKREDLVEGVINQGGAGEGLDSFLCQFRILDRCDQGSYVVAAQHGAEDLHCLFFGDERGFDGTGDDAGEESGLHLGCRVNARGNPLLEEFQQECLFAGGRSLQQFAKSRGLLRVERFCRNPECLSFCLLL